MLSGLSLRTFVDNGPSCGSFEPTCPPPRGLRNSNKTRTLCLNSIRPVYA